VGWGATGSSEREEKEVSSTSGKAAALASDQMPDMKCFLFSNSRERSPIRRLNEAFSFLKFSYSVLILIHKKLILFSHSYVFKLCRQHSDRKEWPYFDGIKVITGQRSGKERSYVKRDNWKSCALNL
jgi:hypothetical protein